MIAQLMSRALAKPINIYTTGRALASIPAIGWERHQSRIFPLDASQ